MLASFSTTGSGEEIESRDNNSASTANITAIEGHPLKSGYTGSDLNDPRSNSDLPSSISQSSNADLVKGVEELGPSLIMQDDSNWYHSGVGSFPVQEITTPFPTQAHNHHHHNHNQHQQAQIGDQAATVDPYYFYPEERVPYNQATSRVFPSATNSNYSSTVIYSHETSASTLNNWQHYNTAGSSGSQYPSQHNYSMAQDCKIECPLTANVVPPTQLNSTGSSNPRLKTGSTSVDSLSTTLKDTTETAWQWTVEASKSLLSGVDFVGGKLAEFLGITTPRYQYYIDQYEREREKEREARAFARNSENRTFVEMESQSITIAK